MYSCARRIRVIETFPMIKIQSDKQRKKFRSNNFNYFLFLSQLFLLQCTRLDLIGSRPEPPGSAGNLSIRYKFNLSSRALRGNSRSPVAILDRFLHLCSQTLLFSTRLSRSQCKDCGETRSWKHAFVLASLQRREFRFYTECLSLTEQHALAQPSV